MQTLESKQYLANTLSHLPTINEQDLNRKTNKVLEKCTSCIYSIANEPTLACFCIEEHVFKTGVQLTEKSEEMRKLDKQLSGALFDIDFSIESIKKMKNTTTNFKTTQDLIKDAIFHKQQIDYNNLSKRRFNQQMMEKDHSVNDFRRFNTTSNNIRNEFQNKQNAFQRFSTSFEQSIEGLASSASVVEFKDAIKHITQLTSSNFTATTSSSSTTTTSNNNKINLNDTSKNKQKTHELIDQPSTSKVLKDEEELNKE